MFCIAAFFVLSILGLFSATHRSLAQEAFACVWQKVKFQPCNTSFREKMQSKILSQLLKKSPPLAKFTKNHFELLSWIFMLLMLGSTAWVIYGGYNFYWYGNCNGPQSTGFCVFDPSGKHQKVSGLESESCGIKPKQAEDIIIQNIRPENWPQSQKPGAKQEVIFIGCYSCAYTRDISKYMNKLQKDKDINFSFIHFPVHDASKFISNYDYCAYQEDPVRYWDYQQKVFQIDITQVNEKANIEKAIQESGYDLNQIRSCTQKTEVQDLMKQEFKNIEDAKVYGTPTVLINGKAIVGPQPDRVYRHALRGIFN